MLMINFLRSKKLTAAILGLVIIMLCGLVALCACFISPYNKTYDPPIFLEGEYSIDGGEWNEFDPEKEIQQTFNKIVFYGRPLSSITSENTVTIIGKNIRYTLYDNSILKQNMNGEILGIYSPSDIIIDDIAASGHNAAAVCGGTVLILKEKDFKVFKPDEPSDNEPVQSSTKPQESSQKPQNSAKPQESSQKPQSSAKPQESSQKPQSSAKPQESSQKPQSSAKPQESSQEPQSSAKLQESSQKPQSSTKPQESSQKQQSSTKPQESSQKPQSSDPRVSRRTQDRSSRTESSSVLPQNEEVSHKTDIMIESDTYIIRDSVIENVPYETTIAMIKKNIRYSGEMRFINYNGKELKSGKLGTGAVIEITAANGQTYRYDLVVPGDITGEGSFNSNDVRKIVKAATNEEELSTPQLLAADVNHDDVFDILDISILCGEYYKNECSSGKGAFLQ